MHKIGCDHYGGIHEFSPDTIMNAAKVHVCECQDLNPRMVLLFRENEVLIPIKRWAEKGFNGMPPQTFDPNKSFHVNSIKERERFWLVDDPSVTALCPICMEKQKPELDPGFDCLSMRFHCRDCDWHWEVSVFEDSKILVRDEMVHVILEAPFGTVHRNVPSNMKVSQVVEAIVRQACGVRGEVKGPVIFPEDVRVFDRGRELRKDLSLAEQGIHYSTYLRTPEAREGP